MSISVVVSIVETVRGVGIYAIVDGALCFVPRDYVDGIMSGLLEGKALTYLDARAAAYKACALAPPVLAEYPAEEAKLPLPDRIAKFATPADAGRHWAELRDASQDALRAPLQPSAALAAPTTVDELMGRPPSAIGLSVHGAPNGVAVGYRGVDVATGDGATVRVQVRETIFGVGTYLFSADEFYFLPTRALGELTTTMFPGPKDLREYGLAAAAVFARMPTIYAERRTREADRPFSRRTVRFDSEAEAVGHRTRLAAMFQLPASPTLTDRTEAQFHFVDSNHHCDSALLGSATPSWSQA
jgi:hypothetical protein